MDPVASRAAGPRPAGTKPPPLDLSHHFSDVTRQRQASKIKSYYRFFQIPNIGNLAGGLPNVRYFPFDTLEAEVAKPERWVPSPNHPQSGDDGSSSRRDDEARATAVHVVVPKTSTESNPLKKIDLSTALQYGTSEGYPPLRSFVRQFTRECMHPNVPYAGGPDVILSCGSTDGFSKTLELLTNHWIPGKDDVRQREGLLVEVFMYSNVLAQSMPRGLQIVPVEIDSEGLLANGPGGLEEVLSTWNEENGKRPHLLYTVTMGHNPTGGLLSVERRRELYAVCSKYDVIIVEDDPYWYLQFPSAASSEAKSRDWPTPAPQPEYKPPKSSGYPFLDSLVPSFLSFDVDGRVVRLDTFSKTIAPGCRMGWITAQPSFIERLMRIAETSTQHPSGFVQSMVAEVTLGTQPAEVMRAFLSLKAAGRSTFSGWQTSGWVRWLAGLRGEYERRMQRMCTVLDAHDVQLKQSTPRRPEDSDWGVVTKTPLYSFHWPRGGMFVWLRVHFESHPLWLVPGVSLPSITGPVLATALLIFLTRPPFRVLAAPGLMFSANPTIESERGWRYVRLCFAAEAEDRLDACSLAFASGLQKFWRVKSVEEIESLYDEFAPSSAPDDDGLANLASPVGC